jgi:DNA-binding LytR/AlgR family response regulator
LKIALVDDEIIQLQRLHELLSAELTAKLSQTPHWIDGYRSGQSFLDHWQPGKYDVVILDIFMGGLTGVDVAKKIRLTDPDVKLVFCSRSNEFAAESYQVNAQYYLVKPATPGSISNMLQRLNLELIQMGQTITLPDGHSIILRQILFTEYFNHVVTIHLKNDQSHRLRINHSQLEEILSPYGYIYCSSKGILVNFHEVLSIAEDSLTMSTGVVLPISRRKSKDVQAAFAKFRFQKLRSEVEV